ncbi:MAG: ABC transporter substrate-binding protein [Patescibacteria group bacterium]
MKKIWIPIIVIVIIIVLIVVFYKPAPKGTIKIGAIAPLSGEMANWGESMRGGIEIGVDEINSSGGIKGRRIEIIWEDNQACDKTASVTAFRKLIDIDKVKVVIIGCSGATLSVAPIAEENKIILLTPMASAAKISEAGDFIFRTSISDNTQGKILGKYIIEKLNFEKIGAIYVNNDYGVGLFDNLKNSFENAGGNMVQAEKYEFGATDFKTQLIKIKAQSPEVLLIICYGSEGGLIAKQARELGMDIQIIGTDNFGTKEVVEAGKSTVEGSIFSTPALDDTKPGVQTLKAEFQKKYGKEPSILIVVADAYDATKILIKAIQTSGYDSSGIKDYLYSVKDYWGVTGNITIDKNGDAEKPISLQTVKNGQFVPYEE